MSTVLDDVLILSDGRHLGYRVRGDRTAVPILHFHGQPGSRLEADIFPDDALDAADAKVGCYDRPGMGRSDLTKARDMVDDLPDAIALLDHLGIGQVGVSGWSAGGPWAFAFAATYPDRVVRVVPIAASGPYDEGSEPYMHDDDIEEMRDMRTRSAEVNLQGYESDSVTDAQGHRCGVVDMACRLPGTGARVGDPRAWQDHPPRRGSRRVRPGASGILRESEVRALPWSFDPSTIRCPVRAFHGDRDSSERLDNLERILAQIPDASVTVYPGGGHISPLLHPEQLLAAATGERPASESRR